MKFIKCCTTVLLLIFLLLLVFIFRSELMVAGVRLYAFVYDSPRANRYLGDYYRYSAELNTTLSNNFYVKGYAKLKKNMALTSEENKPSFLMSEGRYYECGKGMPVDLKRAQQNYQEAIALAKAKGKDTRDFQKHLDRVNKAIANKTTSPCQYSDEQYFTPWTGTPRWTDKP